MRDNFDQKEIIDPELVKAMSEKSDFPALFKIIIHYGLFVGMIVILAAFKWNIYLEFIFVLVLGFLIFSLYAPFHETTHKTAFKSFFGNFIGAWITGFSGYSPGMHEGFHFQHHRYTNEIRDPEKGYSLPQFKGRMAAQVALAGVLGLTVPFHSLILSFVPVKHWDKFEAGWAPAAKRKAWRWECRLMALLWITSFFLLSYDLHLMTLIVLALIVGRLIHGFIIVSEHEGLSDGGDMLDRTRSIYSSRFFRWFWWNMNFHAEHHAWPSIPFHRLNKIHEIRKKSKSVENLRSYFGFFLKRQYRNS
jgi:fatty acid desaturase